MPDSPWLVVLRHRGAVLTATALAAMVLIPGLLQLETDNSPEVFFVRGTGSVERYRTFQASFGAAGAVRVVAGGEGLWTEAGLRWLAEVGAAAAALPEVTAVAGLWDGQEGSWPPEDPVGFRESLPRLPRALGLVSDDSTLATVLVTLRGGGPDDALRGLEAFLDGAPPGVEAQLVGLPVLNRALDASSREIGRLYSPLLAAFAAVVLAVVFRSLAALLAPLALVALAELVVLGPMGYAGVPLNLVLAILPPLLFVIALATALHLQIGVREGRGAGGDPASAVAATYRQKGWAVLWAGLTTAAGFASLIVSPVGPIRSLGGWAAAGLALLTLAAFTVYPPLLSALGARPTGPGAFERWSRRFGRRCAAWAVRRRGLVLATVGATALAAAAGLPRIEIESNALRYLPPEHRARRGIEQLEARGIGVAAVEVLLRLPPPATFEEVSSVGALERLADRIAGAGSEPVLGVVSAGTLLEDAARRAPLPAFLSGEARRRLAWQALLDDPIAGRALGPLLSSDRSTARLSVFVRTAGIRELEALTDDIEESARAALPQASLAITGQYPLLLESQEHLIETLIASLGLTLVAVATILAFLLPGARFTALSLAPNLWPVLGVLGVMGWGGVPLDIATVMVASVVLGLAVDDTIHTLGHFRRLAGDHGPSEAVVRTLERTAPAYLLTGLVLAAGFGVCALSDFAPTARFGALSAIAIGLAVVGDLVLLPALLSLTPERSVRRLG